MVPTLRDREKAAGLGRVWGFPPQIHRKRSAKMNRNPKVRRAWGSSCRGTRRRKNRSMRMPAIVATAVAARVATRKLSVRRITVRPT